MFVCYSAAFCQLCFYNKDWIGLEDMNDSPVICPFHICYHWNHPEIHSHIGKVVSMTLEYEYINGTSVHTTMSSEDLFKHSICLQCSTGHLTLPQSISCRWLLSNSMSHRLDRVYTTFVVFFWETSTLNNTNCVNYIYFIIDIKLSTNFRLLKSTFPTINFWCK